MLIYTQTLEFYFLIDFIDYDLEYPLKFEIGKSCKGRHIDSVTSLGFAINNCFVNPPNIYDDGECGCISASCGRESDIGYLYWIGNETGVWDNSDRTCIWVRFSSFTADHEFVIAVKFPIF